MILWLVILGYHGPLVITMFFLEIPVFNANSIGPDQRPHSAASNLDLHCLPFTILRISRLKWIDRIVLKISDLLNWNLHLVS